MKNKIIFCAFSVFLFLAACTNNNAYFQYHAVSPEGWNKDSIQTFNIEITDTLSSYNIYVNVRNTPEYKNQNLWLFIEKMTPDNVLLNDTIEFYLTDVRGKWLGSGAGAIKEMPVLYKQNVRFEKTGMYIYKIRHGMRYDNLVGISDIGMRVEKNM